jgi:hypothetical protein|tara:strand:+ start:1588 stop:2526 length:939 start_codon:yes stop_codon:yes gene_type:complete
VGFSSLIERNEALTPNSLRARRAILDGLFQEHSGRIFNTAGNSVLAEFQSAVSAIICATKFQKLVQERNTSVEPEAKMHFHIRLNMGDVIIEATNLYSQGVNVAAQLDALSRSDGVCLSKKICGFVSQKVELSLNDFGDQKVNNTIVHAFDIALEGIPARDTAPAKSALDRVKIKSPSVVVLTFLNMSNDPDQECFADRMTEDIITTLLMWKTFPVISRNSRLSFKGTGTKSSEIMRSLGSAIWSKAVFARPETKPGLPRTLSMQMQAKKSGQPAGTALWAIFLMYTTRSHKRSWPLSPRRCTGKNKTRRQT